MNRLIKKIQLLTCTIISLFFTYKCIGQNLNACYGTLSNELAYQMTVSSNGDYLLIGNQWDNSGNIKSFIVRCNQNGDTIWTKLKNGRGTDIKELSNGNIIVCAEGGFGMPNYHQVSDYATFMMDSNGNILWEKCFGGSDYEYPTDMLVCNDGGIIIIGRSESNDGDVQSNNAHGWWLVKIDQNGNIIWEKSFGGGNNNNMYGKGPQQIIQLSNGSLAICGFDDGFTNGYGDIDAYVILFDNNGTLIWDKVIGGTNYPNTFDTYGDRAYSLCQTNDGNVIVAVEIDGYLQAPLPNGDITEFFALEADDRNIFLVKLDKNSGGILEKKTLNLNQDLLGFSKIAQLSTGPLAIVGTAMIQQSVNDCCHSQVMLSILPTISGQISSFQFGGNDGGFSALNTGYDYGVDIEEVNNEIIIFGTNNSYDGLNHGKADLWLYKPSINITNSINSLSIEENKKVIRVINLIGQEVEFTPNTPLIFLYDDGSAERVYQLE